MSILKYETIELRARLIDKARYVLLLNHLFSYHIPDRSIIVKWSQFVYVVPTRPASHNLSYASELGRTKFDRGTALFFFSEPPRPGYSSPAMFLMGLCRNRADYPLGYVYNMT